MPQQEIDSLHREINQNVSIRKRTFINSLHARIYPNDLILSRQAVREQFRFWNEPVIGVLKQNADAKSRLLAEALSQITIRDLAQFSWQEVRHLMTKADNQTPDTAEHIVSSSNLYHWRKIASILTFATD